MYEQVFNFNSRPFTSTPYVKHYFPASAMNQAFGQAVICVQRGSGPVVAIGDIGTGKSLLLAKLESEFHSKLQVVTLVCSSVNSRKEFLQNILFQIGLPFTMDSETELRFAVTQAAQPTETYPGGLLLLIDDAEMLATDVFDELRVLSNIVVDGTPQVRVVLAGRKSLEERLADPTHASFSQRIASRVFLNNLSRDETAAYVIEHINRVGGNGQTMFPDETAAKIQEVTDGCPRLINQVCDFGLILAGTRGLTTLSASLIEEAWNDVQSLPMGRGSVQTEFASKSTATSENSEWTLIEFGQLDDDSQQPNDATVYDFENSGDTKESIVGYSPEGKEVETEAQPQQAEQPVATSENVDAELGIDIASLQAMQTAAAAKQEAPGASDNDPAEAQSPQEPTVNDSATEPQDQGSAHDTARIAMEQQLAAVFGTSLPSSAPAEAEKEDASDATSTNNLEPPCVSTPELPTDSALADQPLPFAPETPDSTDSIAGTVAYSAVAAGILDSAVHSFTPEITEDKESFKPATTALSEQDLDTNQTVTGEQANVVPAAAGQAEPVSEETNSFTPAFPISQAVDFAPATLPIETVAEAAPEPSVETPVEPQLQPPELERPAASDNPFAESFAVEASVPNRHTADIIQQNQNALKISSSDLQHVQPTHDSTPDQIIHPAASQPADASQATDASQPADASQTTDASRQSSASPVGVNWLSTPAADASETVDADAPALPPADDQPPARGFSIMPVAGIQTPSIQAEPESPQPVELTADDPTEPATPEAAQDNMRVETPAGPASIGTNHNYADESDENISADISRQADEILARLSNVNIPAEVVQEDKILADIQAQQREVTDSQLIDSQLIDDLDQPQSSLPIPAPDLHQDDSEMLVVNQDVNATEVAGEPDTFPMTDSPISSGRAARMDYEQLFDRLRNLPDGDQK